LNAIDQAMEQRVDDMVAIGREIAGLEGASDTGMGAGQYEVYITRSGVEYRVTIEPYWDNDSDEPLSSQSDSDGTRSAETA
jgi:hypothetical protein